MDISTELVHDAGTLSVLAGNFGVKWPLLIAQIFNFCLVAFLLYRFAFKPILETIDERTRLIKEGLQYAEATKLKLAEAEKEHEAILTQASQEARTILDESRQRAKEYTDQMTREAGVKVQTLIEKGHESVTLERQQMLTEVRKEVARLVVNTTIQVLNRSLSAEEKSRFANEAAHTLEATPSSIG